MIGISVKTPKFTYVQQMSSQNKTVRETQKSARNVFMNENHIMYNIVTLKCTISQFAYSAEVVV